MFHGFNLNIDRNLATLLLSGIIGFTANVTKNISKGVFTDMEDLFNSGADYYQAFAACNRDLTLEKIHEIGDILKKVEKVAPGVYGTSWERSAGLKMRLRPKDLLKFNEIYDCDLAFAYLPSSEQAVNKVYFKAFSKKAGLKNLLKLFKGKGSNYDGLVVTALPYKDFIKELLPLLVAKNINPENTPREAIADPLNVAGKTPEPLSL